MLDVVDCIVGKHNLWLVLVAALICALSVTTTLQSYARAARTAGGARLRWLIAAGALGGAGIWATHFVAMLAYCPSLSIQYDLPLTVLSLMIGMGGAGLGFGVAIANKGRPELGGALVGASIVAMHYLGLTAVRAAFGVEWNPVFIAASVVISIGFSAAALFSQHRWTGRSGRVGAALLLLTAIVGLHFTGMTAVKIIPDLTARASPEVMSRPVLATVVGGVVFLILAAAAGLAAIEARSRRANLNTLSLAFQGLSSSIVLYDAAGRVVLWNEAFESLMASFGVTPSVGLERKGLMNATLPSIKPPGEDRISYEDAILRSDAPWEGALPDGRWLRIERRALADGGLISILTDTTVQRRWAEAMQEARDKAEAASRAKSEFLANMSHEIRTPLNGLLGMIQVMDRDVLEPRQRERLGVAHQSSMALMGVLNDILDHAKVEAGQVDLQIEPFNTSSLAASVCAAFSSAATLKGLTLNWRVEGGADGWWTGDVLKLRRILSNLVGNAVKFTPTGHVDLVISVDGEQLVFTVRDTGIGINPKTAEQLFETFAQADGSTSRKFGGAGLGLAICRGLTGVMGGNIRIGSRVREGSSFIVTLPLNRIAEPDQASEQGASACVEAERPLTILVAEDNPVNQLVLRALLEPLNVELIIVDGGLQAVNAFKDGRFDLVLMDIQMPEMSGIDAARAIRILELSRCADPTPIIAVTANVMAEQLLDYTAAGMNDFVAKPIKVERLYAVMAQLLETSQAA